MLGVRFRRNNPRYLRQLIRQNVLPEDVEQRSALQDVRSGFRFLCQSAAVGRILILMKIEQRIIAIVSDIGFVAGPTPKAGGVKSFADVLVNFPGDSRFLQQFGIS
jgi:hypothetical protein